MSNRISTTGWEKLSTEEHRMRIAMLIQQFSEEFPSDAACLKALCDYAGVGGDTRICSCGNEITGITFESRWIKCNRCKAKVWLTAGTFFENLRHPRPWLAYIWLSERGVSICAQEFAQLFTVSYSTAFEIAKKIEYIANEVIADDVVELPAELFLSLFRKRTRETPARASPRAEQDRNMTNSAVRSQNKDSELSQLSDPEKLVYDVLTVDTPLSVDQVFCKTDLHLDEVQAALVMLELQDLAVRAGSDRFSKIAGAKSHKADGCSQKPGIVKTVVKQFSVFIEKTFGGIGRKYLQLFVASWWRFVDRQRWCPSSLLTACQRAKKVTSVQLRNYVTPEFVRIPRSCFELLSLSL